MKFTIIIEDISEGGEKGLMATFPELNNSIVFGEDFKELSEGIALALESTKRSKFKKK